MFLACLQAVLTPGKHPEHVPALTGRFVLVLVVVLVLESGRAEWSDGVLRQVRIAPA